MEFKQKKQNITLLLGDINIEVIRSDIDIIENKKYLQCKINIEKKEYMFFKYYQNNIISQIFYKNIEYMGFYKKDIIKDIINNNYKHINIEKHIAR